MLPVGAMMMFALTACPAGWHEQKPAQLPSHCGPACVTYLQTYTITAPQPYIWCVKEAEAR